MLKQSLINILLWIGLFLINHLSVFAQKEIIIDANSISKGVNIEDSIYVYSGDNNADIENVFQAAPSYFKKFKWEELNTDQSSHWVKMLLKNSDYHPKQLVLNTNRFDFIELYTFENNEWNIKVSGNKCPHDQMEMVVGAISHLIINLPENKMTTVLLRVSNDKKINYQYSVQPFTLYSKEYFNAYNKRQNLFNYFFWGAILIITLYNLVFYFQLKNRIYLFYVLNNFTILVFVLSQAGVLSEMFTKSSANHETFLLVFGNIAFIFYMLFCKEFLDLKNSNPKLNSIINKILIFWPFPLILLFFDLNAIAVSIGGIIALWGYTTIILFSVRSIRAGNHGAKYFLAGNIFYYVGTVISILQIGAILPAELLGFTAVNFVEFGSLVQLTLFSLTVGYRIRQMQNEIIDKQLEQERIKNEEEQKRRLLIEAQNKELEEKVKERTIQLEKKSADLEYQNTLIEEKNKEIMDSISYAKRLQEAILPPVSFWQKNLPDSFVLYQPKDIVAGDFYWMETIEDWVLFASADCTGHGVPGAMVSVVCSNALNRAVKEFKLYDPAKILDKVRELVIETFERSESEVLDGMDISLCGLNSKTMKLLWAEANNPIWIIQDGILHEIVADKQPIGKHPNSKSFTSHAVQLKKGDVLYIFTDGYADQFGGPKGKKFKYKQLEKLIQDIYIKPLQEQRQVLKSTFENWKGILEQIDDVCGIGVRI